MKRRRAKRKTQLFESMRVSIERSKLEARRRLLSARWKINNATTKLETLPQGLFDRVWDCGRSRPSSPFRGESYKDTTGKLVLL